MLFPWSDNIVRIYLLLVVVENHLLLEEIIIVITHILNNVFGSFADDMLVAHVDLVLIATATSRRRDIPILQILNSIR